MSEVSLAKAAKVASLSRGSFSDGPKIFGKKLGSNLPSAKLASVTAKGPPFL